MCARVSRFAAFHERGLFLPRLRELGVPVAEFPLHTRLAHPNTALQIARLVPGTYQPAAA